MTGADRQAERLVEARGVTVRAGGRAILDRVDLAVHAGEIVTVVGLNGAGKSTLVRAVLGLREPDDGKVWRRPGLRIGYSPQHLEVDPTLPLSVERFLTLGAATPPEQSRAVLEEVGIAPLLHHPFAGLSGGERQRAVLARALLRDPDLLVLDEPLAGIDVAGQSDLYRLIEGLRDRRRCGVLLVSHDLHVVMAATDTVVCMNHHVCCTGRPESVARNPEFVSLFGSEVAEVIAVYAHRHDHRHGHGGETRPLEPEPAAPAAPPPP